MKDNSTSGSSGRSSSEDKAMAAHLFPSGVSFLAEEKKQLLANTPAEGLGPGISDAEQWTLSPPSKNDDQHEKRELPGPIQTTKKTPTEIDGREARRIPAPSFRGERTSLLQQSQARHAASASFDATSSNDEFTRSLQVYGSRGAVEIEHSSQRQVIHHGSTTGFYADVPLQRPTGGGANNNDSNNNPMFMTPCALARPAAVPATEGVGSARQSPHHHGRSSSFDANANLQTIWSQLPLETRDQLLQDVTLRTQGATEPGRPSPLLRQEQPWRPMSQSSTRMHSNGSIDRIGGSSGGTYMNRSFCTPERRHTPSGENDESSPIDKKRKRLPYRCKKCGQMKNKHECPTKLKNSDVETRGSQTPDLPPGTVFEANDVPLPAENGRNVFYARPYLTKLHTHDQESGPFQYPAEVTAASTPRESNTAMAAGKRGHHWNPPEDTYSPSFPSNRFRGISPTRTTENAGVVTPLTPGQDDHLYSGSGGGGGGGGSAQQGDPWQKRGFCGDGDRFGAANMGLAPAPPSVGPWNSTNMDGTNTSGLVGPSCPSSSGYSRLPGGRNSWQYTAEEGGGAEQLPSAGSAPSSMTPIQAMPMPSPSASVDRWRLDNPQVQPPSSISIDLTPRLQNLERIVFSDGFTRVSLGPAPAPASNEEKQREEEKEAAGSEEASSL